MLIVTPNQDRYMQARYGANPLGLHVEKVVETKLATRFGGLPEQSELQKEVVAAEELVESTCAVNALRDRTARRLFTGRQQIPNLFRPFLAVRQLELREAWLGVGVDYLLYAAQRHDGNLSEIPVLEPKSITYAKTVYPFKGEPPYFTAES